MPAVWALPAVGVLLGLAARALSVLALGESESQAPQIALTTGQAFGGFAALWIAATLCAEDLASPLVLAAECTRAGRAARIAGRVLAASAIAVVAIYIVILGVLPWMAADGGLSLLLAHTWVALGLAAWGSLFAATGRPGLAVLGGLVAWFLGHLPWGSPDLLPGWPGRVLAAWLPGPHAPPRGVADAGYTLPAALATVCLAWTLAPRRESGD